MLIVNTEQGDFLNSLLWYMSARHTSLRAALKFRTPLSVNDQNDMRVQYSAYFTNLLSATELFLEKKIDKFQQNLHTNLVFDGHSDGKLNYYYIREIRNAIIHRGLDIAASAHIHDNFPMIIAPNKICDKWKKNTFNSFGQYLLDIIIKCETVIGPTMLDSLDTTGLLNSVPDIESAKTEFMESVSQSTAMPEDIKALALAVGLKSEWILSAHRDRIEKLRLALTPCNIT